MVVVFGAGFCAETRAKAVRDWRGEGERGGREEREREGEGLSGKLWRIMVYL